MPIQAKVYARVFSHARDMQLPDGWLKVVLEYVILNGPQRSGKLEVAVGPLNSERNMEDDMKEALAAALSTKYAPEIFRVRDIVGLGV